MLSRISISVCIVAALTLAGCGRRGPLEPPPGTPAAPAAPSQPMKPPAAEAPGGLFRNTTAKVDEPAPKSDSETSPGKSTPFILDPLL